jgi:hypothetical protein
VTAVNGDDYFDAIKCTHIDDYGNTVTSEDTANVYVKPYTPEAPTVSAPTVSTVDVVINAHVNAAAGLDYAIYVTPDVGAGNNWVQTDGTVGDSVVWRTIAAWDTITVTGLVSPVSQYSFQTKSRNSVDDSTESDLSTTASITNTTPVGGYTADNVIPSAQVSQSTDGNGIVTVTFRVKDAQSDLATLESFQYSDDGGSNWYTPTNADSSGALTGNWPANSGSKFSSATDWTGTVHSFTFNTRHADVNSSHSLDSTDVTNFQVRFKVNDGTDLSGFATSQDQILDNVAPSVAAAIHFETPPASGTSITLDAAFTESNPDSNIFYYDRNGTGYDGGTVGQADAADPVPQAITVTEVNGDDYFSAIKCRHVDDYGNTVSSEDTNNVYVKPYTPAAPTVINPTVSTVDVAVNPHASAASGLVYAIYFEPTAGGNWVQTDGTVGGVAVWQTDSAWDTLTVTGLSSPVSKYSFRVKSRNSVDNATESNLSAAASTANTAPVGGYTENNVIPVAQVVQSTDGNGVITISFRVKDAQSDLVTAESFRYSDNGGGTWYTPINGDSSGALSGSWPDNDGDRFTSGSDWSGTVHSFTFNTKHTDVDSSHSLDSTDIGNFRVRFKVYDSLSVSEYVVSQNQILDNVGRCEHNPGCGIYREQS